MRADVLPEEKDDDWKTLILTASLLMCQWVTAEPQENATLPYTTLCRLAAMDLKGIAGLTNQEIRLTIKSKTPGVKPSDIRLHIESATGQIPVPLNSDGTFSLPISQELLRENPMIVANQPKGTMELEGSLTLKGTCSGGLAEPADNRLRYNSLFFLEDVKNRLMSADLGEVPMSNAFARTVVAVRLIPQKDAETATVVIESSSGRVVVPKQHDGAFLLKHDPVLAKKNPSVLVATNHEWKVETELQDQAEPRPPAYRR